jgi:hypothetical protein
MNRNSTSFPLELFEKFKQSDFHSEYAYLKYYQALVRHYYAHLMPTGVRGLLIYHTMGLGKSILGISLAIDSLETHSPIMLMSKSLHNNMRDAVKKYVKLRSAAEPDYYLGKLTPSELDSWINIKFSFASMNASNMIDQIDKLTTANEFEDSIGNLMSKFPTLDGRHIIIDEAHNFFRAIVNGSKNALTLYTAIMKARDVKLTFMSGTPVATDPFELVPCFNMLTGDSSTLPEDYKDFYSLFVDKDRNTIKNKCKFQNRIVGLISHVSHTSTFGAGYGLTLNGAGVEFPEMKDLIVERVHMDRDQYTAYGLARDKELEEMSRPGARSSHTPALTKPKSGASSTYRVHSRMLSNFYYPPGLEDVDLSKLPKGSFDMPKFLAIISNIEKHPGRTSLVYSQFTGSGGLEPYHYFLKERGWIEVIPDVKSENMKETTIAAEPVVTGGSDINYFDKIRKQVQEAIDSGRHHYNTSITGSNDKTSDEGRLINDEYILFDINKVGSSEVKKYAVITGSVDHTQRAAIQALMTSQANLHGEIIDSICISSTGAEGLDLKGLGSIHVMEPYFMWGRNEQIFSRGHRNDSHKDMPNDEKWVQPYIYLAVAPESEYVEGADVPKTTDEELYEKSLHGYMLIESFTEALREVSIECAANAGSNCRMCSPTGQKLFTNNVISDVAAADPCVTYVEKKIQLPSIEYMGIKYYYNDDPNSLYDYAIYKHDERLDAYKRLPESDTIIAKLVELIEK